jgi:hypothetical protein
MKLRSMVKIPALGRVTWVLLLQFQIENMTGRRHALKYIYRYTTAFFNLCLQYVACFTNACNSIRIFSARSKYIFAFFIDVGAQEILTVRGSRLFWFSKADIVSLQPQESDFLPTEIGRL